MFAIHPSSRARGAVAAVLVGGALAACSAGAQGTADIDVSSQVDARSGTITFPADRLALSADDQDALATAQSVALAECARGIGVDYTPLRVQLDPIEKVSTYFGVWRKEDARRFGFVAPQTPSDMVHNDIEGRPEQPSGARPARHLLTDAERERLQPCQTSDDVQRFSPEALTGKSPWNAPLGEVEAGFYGLPEVRAVIDEYDQCLRGRGAEPRGDLPGSAVGADPKTISPAQVKLALKVVACKSDVDYVPRLARIMADEQAPIIARYGRDMVAFRSRVDRLVADANTYTAEHAPDIR